MTVFWLKVIACVTMLLDHIGFSTKDLGLRAVGRVSFPIFAFLITQGFIHTKSFKKYLSRLVLFALLSEVPYDLYFHKKVFYLESQNIFFTLALGLASLWFLHRFKDKPLWACVLTAVCCAVAHFMKTDYGYIGVLTVVLLYVFRHDRFATLIALTLTSLWRYFVSGSPFMLLQIFRLVALVPIFSYNGREGYKSSFVKYGFYAFYPLHLILLYFIFN